MRLDSTSPTTLLNPSPAPANLEPVFPRNDTGMAEEDSMRSLILFARKRGWLVVAATLLGLAGAIVANMILSVRYTARASIELVQDRSSEFFLQQTSDLRDASSMDAAQIDTVIEVLKSSALALETIQRLGLQNNPDFLKRINGHAWNLSEPTDRAVLISNFIRRLDVGRLGHTNIVEIRFSSPRPELASLVANTLIDSYIEHNFKENFTSTAKVSDWLDTQLGGLKKRLEDSQQRMVELQKELGIFGIDQSKDQTGPTQSVPLSNLEELNKELGPLEEFILPGGSSVAAQLHVARTICRRVERFCVRLRREEQIGELVVPYLNRLSDALFTWARWANKKAGVKETYWKK